MKLYSFFNSSASYRVRIALALKGLHYQTVGVNIRIGQQNELAYRRMNPVGLVPTLLTDGSRQRPPRRQRGQPVGETAADLECGSGAAPACDHRRALQRLPNLLSGAFVGRPRGGSALP